MAGGASSPQLLVFDTRRGNREGQEIEKVLAFHPADTPPVQQVTTAGLLHGLLLFSSNFSQARARRQVVRVGGRALAGSTGGAGRATWQRLLPLALGRMPTPAGSLY